MQEINKESTNKKPCSISPLIRGACLAYGEPAVLVRNQKTSPESSEEIAEFSRETLADLAALSDENWPGDYKNERLIGHLLHTELGRMKENRGDLPRNLFIPDAGYFSISNWKESTAPREETNFLDGQIALITGAAQGFGAGLARSLVEIGAFVYIADINFNGAQKLADELNSKHSVDTTFSSSTSPGSALAVKADVSSESSMQELAETVLEYSGGLDLLISNAGVLRAGSVLTLAEKDFDFVTRVNYKAFFLLVKHLSSIMIRQNAANKKAYTDIVQINSKSGLTGSSKNAAYAGSKFGAIGLVQSFAMELMEYRIKVNAICPGNFFDGPLWSDPEQGLFVQYLNAGKVPGARSMQDVRTFYEAKVPMGRGCEIADVMKALLYCVEQQYETGQAIPVSGGQIMLN